MGILKCSKDTQVCEFDFAKSGGAIGTYRLGLFIDAFSVINFFLVQPKIPFASAGLATISFGYITSAGLSIPAGFVAASPFGGPFTTLNPSTAITPGMEVTMSIGVAPITAGKMMVLTEYFNTDF